MFNHEKIFKEIPLKLKDKVAIFGGYVRDSIMKEKSNDIDFMVKNTTMEEMIELKFRKVGKDLPIFLDKKGQEYSLCGIKRKSVKNVNKEPKYFNFEDELANKDLTINAMALDSKGYILDPFNGMLDIKNKILRHIGNGQRFKEDPLRVLRLARFTAKYPDFKIHKNTLKLCKTMNEEMHFLKKERVLKEIEKTLFEKKPSNFFRTLKDLDVLDILFPEIYDLYKIDMNLFNLVMIKLDKIKDISENKSVILAVLFSFIYDLSLKDDRYKDIDRVLTNVFIRYGFPKTWCKTIFSLVVIKLPSCKQLGFLDNPSNSDCKDFHFS